MANLIVKSEIKRQMAKFNVSKDFYPKLETEVLEIMTRASLRAEANGRKTVQGKDL